MKTPRPVLHNRDHRRGGADAINGRWFYVGEADAAAFENGWGNAGGTLSVLRYALNDDELVIVGSITGGTSGTVVFTLPATHRPAEDFEQVGTVTASGGLAAIFVDATTGEVTVTEATDAGTVATDLAAHLADTTDAHGATAISYGGSSGLSATQVEAALDELDSEKAAASHTHSGSDITSGTVAEARIDSAIARDAEVAAAYQPLDAELTALSGLTSAADKLPYFTGSGTAALTDISAFARTLLDDANPPAMLATLGAQTNDSDLDAIAALSTTSYGRALLTAANQAGIDVAYGAYTPTWTSTGTAPAIGNATVLARYAQVGKVVHCYGSIVFGSTSTFGTGNYRFALPVSVSSNGRFGGSVTIYDDSSFNGDTSATARVVSTTTIDILYTASHLGTLAAIGQTAPWTWAQNDQIYWDFVFEAA